MEQIYIDTGKQLKAISDPKRLRIIDMLSCGELCACVILEAFDITQPTLSHDMKVLRDAGLTTERREGKNIYYQLNRSTLNALYETFGRVIQDKSDCICHSYDSVQTACTPDCACAGTGSGEAEGKTAQKAAAENGRR